MGQVAEPPPASAEIRAGEAFPLLPIAQARMVGSQRFMAGYQLAGILAGMLVSGILAQLLPWPLDWLGIEADWGDQWLVSVAVFIQLLGTVTGFAIGWNAAVRRHAKKFLAGVKARGTPETIAFDYAIGPDGLEVSSDRISHRLAWHAIQEVMRAPDHWLLQVDTITIIMPRRAFADEEVERRFLRAILERITPQARERSGEAVAFAGQDPS